MPETVAHYFSVGELCVILQKLCLPFLAQLTVADYRYRPLRFPAYRSVFSKCGDRSVG
jgi:hypothetical protein